MPNYRKLIVWRKSHSLVLDVYQLSGRLPRSERYGLQSQLRRAAASIPANIAEGAGRSTDRDYGRFVSNAVGSANELDYHLELARDLGYLAPDELGPVRSQVIEVRRMLLALRARLTQ